MTQPKYDSPRSPEELAYRIMERRGIEPASPEGQALLDSIRIAWDMAAKADAFGALPPKGESARPAKAAPASEAGEAAGVSREARARPYAGDGPIIALHDSGSSQASVVSGDPAKAAIAARAKSALAVFPDREGWTEEDARRGLSPGGRKRIVAPWFQELARAMADNTPLAEAARKCGLVLNAVQQRRLYHLRAFTRMYQAERRLYRTNLWGTPAEASARKKLNRS